MARTCATAPSRVWFTARTSNVYRTPLSRYPTVRAVPDWDGTANQGEFDGTVLPGAYRYSYRAIAVRPSRSGSRQYSITTPSRVFARMSRTALGASAFTIGVARACAAGPARPAEFTARTSNVCSTSLARLLTVWVNTSPTSVQAVPDGTEARPAWRTS